MPYDSRIAVKIISVAVLVATGYPAFAQPPLLFREAWTWKLPPATVHELSHAQRRVTQEAVTNPNLELKLYGADAQDIVITAHDGRYNLWTGMTTSPVALTLRDKNNYIDLSGSARVRWITRTENLHIIHPVIKLADGTLLVGSHTDSSPARAMGEGDFVESEVTFDDQRWFVLDPSRVVTEREVRNPDLSKVDEIGFADLMPGGGVGANGFSNLSEIELFATAHKR